MPVISFAGGEPFLRKDLGLLMRDAKGLGMGVTVVTNAMVPNEDAVSAADETCDAMVFSPHPPSELNGKNPKERWERAWQGFAEMRRALRRPTLTCGITLGKHTVPVLEEIGTEQEQAAHSLGASAWQTFRRITLPSIKWAVLYGVVLALARSLGEFGAVKVVTAGGVAGSTQTVTSLVEQRYGEFDELSAYSASLVLAAASIACLVVIFLIRPRKDRTT